jgi:hypothetical protein
VYFYVDYPVHRIGVIPASAQLFAIRFVCAGLILMVAIALARLPRTAVIDRLGRARLVIGASAALVMIQVAYFFIDVFGEFRARYLHVLAVAVATIGLALLLKGIAVSRLRLGQLATCALVGIAVMQFTYFYLDYFGGYRVRRASEVEGNVRIAYETLLGRARSTPIPAVYLSHKMEFAWLRDVYWKFYVLKHDRQDLLPRTINAESSGGVDRRRIHALPAGTMVVAGVSRDDEANIDLLVSVGELRRDTLVRAADGVPVYWILEKGSGGRR